MSLDPVKPYADLAKVIAIALVAMVLVAALFMGGRAVGVGQSAKQHAADLATIAKKDAALRDAATALGASGKALRAVNDEAMRRIKAADDARKAADRAGLAAAAAERAAKARAAAFDRQMAEARHKAVCAAVFDFDVAKECGL